MVNIDWHDIPFQERQEMLRRAGLLDGRDRLKTKLTRRIKMMVIDSYYDRPGYDGRKVVTK